VDALRTLQRLYRDAQAQHGNPIASYDGRRTSGDPLEIQIRTWENAPGQAYGIGSALAFTRKAEDGSVREQALRGCARCFEWQKDMRDSRVFMENLKLDLFDSQVFRLLAAGDVYSIVASGNRRSISPTRCIPTSETHCVGAKVNGRIVSTRLSNAERRHLRNLGQ